MRLIDADHLRKWIIANGNGWHFKTVEDILDQIDREHTFFDDADIVDAEPIRHGHWVMDKGYNECSICGCNEVITPYCPWCGAKMDEVEEDG